MNTNDFIANRAAKVNISCKTYIITVFGDVVSQHGHWIWLGSLIESAALLGYSERLVRTSVYRLIKDNWLQVKKIGRKSYYAFTGSANNHYTKAARRIYATTQRQINEKNSGTDWLIVIPSFVAETKLVQFKRQLKWLGFSTLTSGVFAHPSFEQSSLEETIKELKITDSVIIFSSKTIDKNSTQALKKLVFEKWNLRNLQEHYHCFVKIYQPIFDSINSNINHDASQLDNQQSYLLRTLLIHEYRRILLQDHDLSSSMLPNNWKGHQANQLVKKLYSTLRKQSCSYIVSNLKTIDGYLPEISEEFNQRFH